MDRAYTESVLRVLSELRVTIASLATKETRAQVIAERIEQFNGAEAWACGGVQQEIAA